MSLKEALSNDEKQDIEVGLQDVGKLDHSEFLKV